MKSNLWVARSSAKHERTASSKYLEAPAPLAGLNEQQHARAARVADVHNPVEVGVPPAGAPPHPGEVGRLVVDGELQDAQPLHMEMRPVSPCLTLPLTLQQWVMKKQGASHYQGGGCRMHSLCMPEEACSSLSPPV